jgi:hypothetical protein
MQALTPCPLSLWERGYIIVKAKKTFSLWEKVLRRYVGADEG